MKIFVTVKTKIKGEDIILEAMSIEPEDNVNYELFIDPPRGSDFWKEVERITLKNSEGALERLVKLGMKLE